jgi:hypothetical protein
MADRRPIDTQRDAAITLQVGGDDKSPAKEFLSTRNALYVIKESGVFKIRLADDIDPRRTNPDIPNLSQRVLTEGYDNEIVARILLTAKTLFDERNATVNPFVADLLEQGIVLTRQVLELDAMTQALSKEISEKSAAFEAKTLARNAFALPSVPDLETKLHGILFKADKAKDSMLGLARLHFMPEASGKVALDVLERAFEGTLATEPQMIAAWKEECKYFALVRNMRNVCEHPKDNYKASLSDFSMLPTGEIDPPMVEIQHPATPVTTMPMTEFLAYVGNAVLEHAEAVIVLLRLAYLLKANPFAERVGEFPEDQRRHHYVRYYRAVEHNGEWRILG